MLLGNVTFDCDQPGRLAEFWAAALRWDVRETGEFLARVTPSDGARPHLLFIKVPEPKTAKNRVHLDFGVEDQEAEIRRLEALGATRRESYRESGFTWTVLADPEGNEFCIGHADQS